MTDNIRNTDLPPRFQPRTGVANKPTVFLLELLLCLAGILKLTLTELKLMFQLFDPCSQASYLFISVSLAIVYAYSLVHGLFNSVLGFFSCLIGDFL